MNYLLTAKNIKVRFVVRGHIFIRDIKRMLRGVDVNVGKGECVAVVGENGSGKRVLAAVLSGECKKNAGRIYFSGKKIIKVPFCRIKKNFDPDILCISEIPLGKKLASIGSGTHLLIADSEKDISDVCDRVLILKDGKIKNEDNVSLSKTR